MSWGGGIWNTSRLTITGSTISNNFANHGGGIESMAPLTIVKSTISGNDAYCEGGGIETSWRGPFVLTGSTISDTSAGRGGGIYISDNSKITIGGNGIDEKNIICGNHKSGEPPSIDQQIGGLFVREDLYVTNKDFNNKDFNTISVYCE